MEPSHRAANIRGNESIMYSRIFPGKSPRSSRTPFMRRIHNNCNREHKGPSGGDESVRPPSQSDRNCSGLQQWHTQHRRSGACSRLSTPLIYSNADCSHYSAGWYLCLHCLDSYLRGAFSFRCTGQIIPSPTRKKCLLSSAHIKLPYHETCTEA